VRRTCWDLCASSLVRRASSCLFEIARAEIELGQTPVLSAAATVAILPAQLAERDKAAVRVGVLPSLTRCAGLELGAVLRRSQRSGAVDHRCQRPLVTCPLWRTICDRAGGEETATRRCGQACYGRWSGDEVGDVPLALGVAGPR
jgi:hypothetical protein